MIEFNDSNANITANGQSAFLNSVSMEEDIYISSTCIFMGDLVTTGNIKAQYSLIVFGEIHCDGNLVVGQDLTCANLTANEMNIGGNLTAKGDIDCHTISVGGNAVIEGLYCTDMDILGNLIALHPIDVQNNLSSDGTIICAEYIEVAGMLKGAKVIAEDVSAEAQETGRIVLYSKEEIHSTEKPIETVIQKEQAVIAGKSIDDVFDASSDVAVVLDDCAVFCDDLNTKIAELDPDISDFRKYLSTYGGFISQYNDICVLYDKVSVVMRRDEFDKENWYDDFNICVETMLMLPDWMRSSVFMQKLIATLDKLLQYREKQYFRTKSLKTWEVTLGNAEKLILSDLISDEHICQMLKQFKFQLYPNIGLKHKSILLNFTEE